MRVALQAHSTRISAGPKDSLARLAAFSLPADKGRFPPAGAGSDPADWIYWEDTPVGTNPQRDINLCPMAPSYGVPVNREVFVCPSDTLNRRPGVNYQFSYSSNYLITRLPPSFGAYPGESSDPLKITEILMNPSNKILLIDETPETVDDGCWAWMSTLGSGYNIISVRHMKRQEQVQLLNQPNAGRGNAVFADFHAEYIERKASFDDRFTTRRSRCSSPAVSGLPCLTAAPEEPCTSSASPST